MTQQKILIQNHQKRIKISKEQITHKIRLILKHLGYDKHEISVVITDNAHIRELNHLYRGIDTATNVLSFSMIEGEFGSIGNLLGDLVISAERAEKEAQASNISTDERMSQLLVHGILHLVGYDHDDYDDIYNNGDEEEGDKAYYASTINAKDERNQNSHSNALKMERKSLELLRLIEPNKELDFF